MRIVIWERNGHEDLANAIVLKAASDYRSAYKKFRKGNNSMLYRIEEIEKFFNSEWGDFLSQGKAKEILRRLQKEQEEKPKKPKRTVKITKVEIYE